MRPFSVADKQLLHELLEQYKDHPKKWIVISEKMSPEDISQRRTPDSLRNHVLRWNNGKKATEEGKSKKKCTSCGELKAGHICKAFAAPRGISKARASVNVQSNALPPLGSALAGYPLAATALVAPGSPRTTQGDDDWLAGPPGLRPQSSGDFMFMREPVDLGLNLPALVLPLCPPPPFRPAS